MDGFDPVDRYERMVEMRTFEELVGEGVADGSIHGEMHLAIGQEATAAGLEPLVREGDAVVSTHRPHLHALIARVDPVRMLGEIFERSDGLCGGKGGHMHLFDPSVDFMCTGIVGASAPIALGYALQRKRARPGAVAWAFLGDGAVNHGTFAEALNLAALWSLPVVFVVEDNGYAISVPTTQATAGAIHRRGEPFGIPGWAVDGVDARAVYEAGRAATDRVRSGDGPALVVATAYRFRGHYEGDIDHYRPRRQHEETMRERDPIARARASLIAGGVGADELMRREEEARTRVRGWVDRARAMPWPDPADALTGVFAEAEA
ncbi:MAG: acetoin:2,6-dichlorophenolindophenol oxidoreductase subunit alpha [Actinomycetota bacterium]|jgi:pyruvate dehydrogenase E1 component alpha subunit|nr:MAG: acetoin:2,6-dichlorophenolindophenol oxidoreductase subunit alpha [Actinomycetota bacterium]